METVHYRQVSNGIAYDANLLSGNFLEEKVSTYLMCTHKISKGEGRVHQTLCHRRASATINRTTMIVSTSFPSPGSQLTMAGSSLCFMFAADQAALAFALLRKAHTSFHLPGFLMRPVSRPEISRQDPHLPGGRCSHDGRPLAHAKDQEACRSRM